MTTKPEHDGDSVPDAATAAVLASRAWRRYALAAAVAVALGCFYLSGLSRFVSWESVHANLDVWQSYVQRHLLLSLVAYFAAYTAITALSLPAAAAMTLVAGAVFGRYWGTAVASLGSTTGATLAFLASRYLFRDWVQSRYGQRLRPINEGIAADGAYYLFLLRLIPAVPFFLINLGMGLTPMRVSTYVVVSWLGMLLGTILYVNAGTALSTVQSPRDVLSPLVLGSLLVLGVVPLTVRKLVQGIRRRR